MEKSLFLMNKDHCILQMSYDDEIHAILKIADIYDLAYAPPSVLDIKGIPNRRTLNEWWRERAIPISRNQLHNDFPYMGDPRSLVEQNMGLSLSDRYWVTEDPKYQKWKDVNFFDNPFTEDLGLITLGEKQQSHNGSENLYSPNATLGGDLRKKWTIQDGNRILLKSGSGLFRQEPYNEVIASALHGRLLDESDFVPYVLQGRYSACPNMLGLDEELIPMYDVIRKHKKPGHLNDFQFCLELCHGLGIRRDVALIHFEKMFTCDFILANSDRHYHNFGLIRNVETLDYTRMAPVYDTGACLWYDKEELQKLSDYRYVAKPFNPNGMTPENQIAMFHDFEWFDETRLKGFVEEAYDILAKNSLMPVQRRDAVLKGLQQNIDYAVDYIKGQRK